MSQRNGDKARFGRQRNRKALLRTKTRELRKVLMGKTPGPVIAAANQSDTARAVQWPTRRMGSDAMGEPTL
ncbi:MAG: hypothetical protein ABSF71_27390 [Terriglobia bacterium]|jgi:hypothetical protein